jgi:hypothetical protein
MNVIESAISSVRQDGIRLRFIFCILGRDWGCISGRDGKHDMRLARKNRV